MCTVHSASEFGFFEALVMICSSSFYLANRIRFMIHLTCDPSYEEISILSLCHFYRFAFPLSTFPIRVRPPIVFNVPDTG